MNDRAETFFDNAKRWKDEFRLLREVVLENDLLTEDFKWMHPCYTYQGKNIVLIHGFKEYCALLFHKGVLLKDDHGVLIKQTDHVQSARQIRFTSVEDIVKLRPIILDYISESIQNEKAGKKVALKKVSEYPVPEEFQRLLNDDEALNRAFHSLTPGRQKGYLVYFNQAKQSKTRAARIAKYYDHILAGKGEDDK